MKYEGIEVVILGQHCLNTLGQIRSIGALGIHSDVIWISSDQHSPKGSRWIKQFKSFPSFEDGLNYLVENYTDIKKKYFISTDSDEVVSLLDLNYNKLKDRFVFFNAGENGKLSLFMPKFNQCNLAENQGMRIPQSELVKRGELPQKLTYPIFTKSPSSKGKWKDNAFICHNPDELLTAYNVISTEMVLLQEFVEKENEIAIEGVSIDGGRELYAPIQGEYLRIKEGSFGTWKKNEAYNMGDNLFCKIKNIFQEIGYSGVFEIEFLKDKNGNLFFLEINFRHTQYNHALTRMGVNLFQIWIDSILQGKLCLESVKRINAPQTVINDPKDFKTYVATGQIGLKQWLKITNCALHGTLLKILGEVFS